MRITQGMLSSNMLNNLSNSYSKMGNYLEQLSTGKKINRPSDDPVIAMKGMNYRSQVIEVEQFQRNTTEVHTWMDSSDAALDKATKALQKMRELAVQASNGTYDPKQRESIMKEVEQLKEHMIDIANTNVNGKFIFNGTKTDTKPIKVDEETGNLSYVQDGSPVMIEVSSGTKLQANVAGSEVFSEDLFTKVNDFIDALDRSDQTDIENSIGTLDGSIDKIINARADLGARMNRLELIEDRLSSQQISAKSMMSKNEDIDYEKVITKLIAQESVHRAALSAGSRIIQPTLLDFLR
ncbi:flagellar hook-associated protein FlgL [Virgibacillus necropolis]|uniref:flagellar hook-associated protein FlgL n=1 Tax=Virgibacillus necropolis TaxID=163877 RepID=UPI00384BD014